MLSHIKREQNDLNPAVNPRRTQALPERLRWRALLGFAASLVVIAGQVHTAFGNPAQVTNLLQPLSQPAQEIKDLSLLVLAICAAIFLIVVGLLVYAIVRFRHRPGDEASEPPQIYGSNQIETAWTVLPILIVFVLILYTRPSSGISGGGRYAIPNWASSLPTNCTCRRVITAEANPLFSNFNRPTSRTASGSHSSPARRMSYPAARTRCGLSRRNPGLIWATVPSTVGCNTRAC